MSALGKQGGLCLPRARSERAAQKAASARGRQWAGKEQASDAIAPGADVLHARRCAKRQGSVQLAQCGQKLGAPAACTESWRFQPQGT